GLRSRSRDDGRAAGIRQASDRAVQVSARDRVPPGIAAERSRQAAAGAAPAARSRGARGTPMSSASKDAAAPRVLQPAGWAKPLGYANGIAAQGRFVFVGGQVGWNAEQRFESADFVAQARQALANIVAVLAEAGAGPEHVVRLTWYVVDKREYLSSSKALGRAYREIMGSPYPAMSAGGEDGRVGGA